MPNMSRIRDVIPGRKSEMGPTYVKQDVLDVLSQAEDYKAQRKKDKAEYKQRMRANRKLKREQKRAMRMAGMQAAAAAGYDRPMILLNTKEGPVQVPVVYDATVRPAPARTQTVHATRTHWELPDCKVDMIDWMGPLKAFRVQMGAKLQTVVPENLKDMQDCIMALNMGVSPVGIWQDGSGKVVSPANAVPRNGPAKKKSTPKKAASACGKGKATGKKQCSNCVRRNGPAKKKTATSGTQKKSTGSNQRKPKTSSNKRVQNRR